jgi:hypothetical protein
VSSSLPPANVREDARRLDAAHARIAELEMLLRGQVPTPRQPVLRVVTRWAALLLAIAILSTVLAIGIVGRPIAIVRGAPAAPPPPIPPGVLEVWSPRFLWDTNGPALVDVLGEGGAHDLVMPAWRRGQVEQAMHLVALRRGTYEVLWRSEPLPSGRSDRQISFAASGDWIAVSDAFGVVHVLHVRSGTQFYVVHPGQPFDRLVAPASRPGFVYAGADDPQRPPPSRIDLASGLIEPTSTSEDALVLKRECASDGTRPCQAETAPAAKSKLMSVLTQGRGEYSWDLVGDGDRVTVVDVSVDHRFPALTLFSWDEGAAKFRWRAPVAPPAQRATESSASSSDQWIAIGNHRILGLYVVGTAGHRVSAHAAETGALLYDVAVPELPFGSEVERLTVDGDVAFVVTNGALLVLDAKGGSVTKKLRAF